MWLKKIHPGIAVSLMVCGALLLSGGVSEIMVKQEPLELSDPAFVEVSSQKSLEISRPKIQKNFQPRSLQASTFQGGKYTRPEQESPAYDRCAKLESFDAKRKCALEAVQGISQED